MGQFSSGLNNLTEIIPDYNSGISVTVTNTNTEIPRDGILKLLFSQQSAVDRSFYVNDEEAESVYEISVKEMEKLEDEE